MKLYHISLDIFDIIKEFTPRVPRKEVRLDSEDKITKRICLSKSIEGCLSGVPWGGVNYEDNCFVNGNSPVIRVYEFDSRDIIENNFISDEFLYESDKVRDSLFSKEVWVVNQKLKPKNTYLIQIDRYWEECSDNISFVDLQKCEKENLDIEEYIEGCFTVIKIEGYENVSVKEALKQIKVKITRPKENLNKYIAMIIANSSIKKIINKWTVEDIINIVQKENYCEIECIINTNNRVPTFKDLESIFEYEKNIVIEK